MKQLSLVFFAIILLSGISKAQTIPNGDFENWNSMSYDEPDTPWVTSNPACIAATGHGNVTKVTGFSGHAIHLQTYIINNNMLIGEVSNFGGFSFGVPYTQTPTAIKGYYRCKMAGQDTGFLAIAFIKGGNLFYQKFIPFYGNVSSFTSFNDTVNLPFAPDSMLVVAVSSNLKNNVGISDGSWLELDELAFTGTGITQQIADGNFDSWTTTSVDILQGWQTPPQIFGPGSSTGVSKSTDHVTGSYSVELIAQQFQSGFQISTGTIDSFGGSTEAIDTLTGYYKYISSGTDSGAMHVVCQNIGNVLLDTGVIFTASSSWKYFEMPFHLSSLPDTMRVDFASSFNFTGTGGSRLWIDELQLKSQHLHTSGILFSSASSFGITAFPNPAQNQLNIRFGANIPSEFGLKIYNLQGRLMIDKEFNTGSSTVSVPIDQLSAGLYFYEVTANGAVVRNKFVKE